MLLAPHANMVTSICRFVSFVISTAFSVDTAAAFALTLALSRRERGLVAFNEKVGGHEESEIKPILRNPLPCQTNLLPARKVKVAVWDFGWLHPMRAARV